jgi:ABC-type enterochelin transport system ATPase subunit
MEIFDLTSIKNYRSPECPHKHSIHMVDHLIFQCKRLKNEREILMSSVLKVGKWPVSKSKLTNRNLKQFIRYINSMDLEKINHSNKEK